ncbi:MAG: M1 family aminopeptidase [Pyrinomonadaceae bacterium]
MIFKLLLMMCVLTAVGFAQMPAVEPGVSLELAKWRAARYSDVRYKLNLTLEKMSPVLKGTMEIKVKVTQPIAKGEPPASAGGQGLATSSTPIILDWRRIRGSESLSTISNVSVNGVSVATSQPPANAGGSPLESNEHLIFRDGVVVGENVIKLDFTSPILTSGSAITRYVDKEDGAEYIYSLFVPSDASTAFPVFDQPDLKARFTLDLKVDKEWKVVSNSNQARWTRYECVRGQFCADGYGFEETKPISTYVFAFAAGQFVREGEPPALAGGLAQTTATLTETKAASTTINSTNANVQPPAYAGGSAFYVRKSQAAKFKPHAAEVFRLNREGIKFLESYFDYKFPFPKYDIVLIPEFPFGGMEHAGATFLRESSVIFPQEPTKNDYISRSNVIFHEAAHQWFGDTVTMKWFDDLWLKEGFAEFMAYKTLEKVQGGNPTGREGAPRAKDADQMPEVNAWKVFYERNKQAAYLTDSTKGTTPIYQEIANLSAAKSAYGNIVYRKAPSFLKQAEFYLGPDKFQTSVRAFLKKHEYANAGWEDLVKEFEAVGRQNLKEWANAWVKTAGLPTYHAELKDENYSRNNGYSYLIVQDGSNNSQLRWPSVSKVLVRTLEDGRPGQAESTVDFWFLNKGAAGSGIVCDHCRSLRALFMFPNYQDYGYGIFLLDNKSRDYVLKNIQNEKDDFLRTMMWGSLWDSVREGELDPREYVELVVKNLGARSPGFSRPPAAKKPPNGGTPNGGTPSVGETDESTIQTLLGRVSTAMRYYIDAKAEPPASAGGRSGAVRPASTGGTPVQKPARKQGRNIQPADNALPNGRAYATDLQTRVEALLIDRMQNASTPGQKITYYRSFLNIASSENARRIMKEILNRSGGSKGEPPASAGGQAASVRPAAGKPGSGPPANAGGSPLMPARAGSTTFSTKDRFDIVSRLIVLGDPEAPKLLADLEKTETSDEAKRYAYAAKAGFATAENKAKFWNDFVANKDISESWIEAAFVPFNNVRHSELTLPYLEKALAELPNLKRSRKIFFVNGWLGAFIGGQKSEQALAIVNKFLADNPALDKDLRLKILENVDVIERAVKIRSQNRER